MVDEKSVVAEDRSSRFVRLFLTYRLYVLGAASLFVFALVAFAIYQLTAEVRYEDVLAALSATSWSAIAMAVLFTGLSFFALIFYDANALDYIGRRTPFPSVAVTALMAYAVGNTVGFGPLSGGAIRFRAYSRLGLAPGEIARVIAFVTLAFGLGLLCVSALATLAVAPRVAGILGIDALWLRAIALLVLAALIALFYAGRSGRAIGIGNFSLRLPDSRTTSRQFLVSAFDIAAAASALYVLLPDTHVGWPTFLAVYAVAIGFGVLSHVPAGLGVFEAIIMAGLSNAIGIDQLLGSLVLYRLIYYVLPLLLATVLLLVTEMRQLVLKPGVAEAAQLAGKLAPSLIAALSLVLGTMLIFSSVVPTPGSDLDFLSTYLPLPIVEGAHFLSSLIGLLLIIAARGLGQRLDGAWWVALAGASVAFAFAFLKAIAVFEAGLLAFFIVALLANARAFDRHSSLLRQALGPSWLAAIAVVLVTAALILLFVYRDTEYAHELWWQFEFSEEAPRGLRALLGLAIAASVLALSSLLRPAHLRAQGPTAEELDRAVAITLGQDVADANLVRMGDKRLLFSPSGNSYIMYGIHGRSWVALSGPIGREDEFPELVWQFVSAARAGGGRASFYQTSPALLSACADVGLRAFKLGELAIIDLAQFEMKGSRFANLRQSYSRGLRDGLTFTVVPPAEIAAILPDLRAVSDGWLDHHNTREKTFSLGAFEDAYVLAQPVAVVRLAERIVAFATLLVTDTKAEATVDLMRFAPDAPKGAMDFLFASIFEYLRSQGYRQFNLGMAPLSGMARREAAPVWDRVGGTLFEHGERFYNFKGLRAFKSKFHPRWEPRYLAVSNGTGAALAMMDVTFLIGGGVKGVISK
ncbi:MAG: bifunctional lysylphosphatidylglycerol flippase/synthetase MprF [Shinella sp.]|uniref:bifunctional lysylphosphatidylglycerol flippase/synthetase MprF n=1 Tax=Shinella sp. TaxID=1870904 RepID=UPI004035926D